MRSIAQSLVSILWAYAWLVPLVIALRIGPLWATLLLLCAVSVFLTLYVIRPVRAQPRLAARLRLRSCARYLPWLTVAAVLKLLLMVSGLALHERLALRRVLPRLPDDPEFVSAAFLASPFGAVALFLAIVVMAPLVEEFAFRGWMQHELEHAIGLVPAIVASGIAFSLLHGRVEAVHHLAYGVFAGWVVWRTGSIWAGVYMHSLNNAVAQLTMYIETDVSSWAEFATWLWPHAFLLGGLALCGFVATGARIHRIAQTVRPRAGAWSSKQPRAHAMIPIA